MVTPGPSSHERTALATEVSDDLLLRIGRAWRDMRRGAASATIKDVVLGSGQDALEAGQWDTLDMLSRRESWRMGDLAEALLVEPSTATRAVQRLVHLGLAERVTHSGDGRQVHVAITSLGRSRHAVIAARSRTLLECMVQGFSDDERHQLAELLERFSRAVDAAATEATRRLNDNR